VDVDSFVPDRHDPRLPIIAEATPERSKMLRGIRP